MACSVSGRCAERQASRVQTPSRAGDGRVAENTSVSADVGSEVMNKRCSRCGGEFLPGDRKVDDPCCGAPDCKNLTAKSHYGCLPGRLQEIEDIYDDWEWGNGSL